MPELATFNITGYEEKPVPNTFIRQPGQTAHLGIVLPGYHYPVEMPSLHFAGQILWERGADVLYVEYAYFRTDHRSRPVDEQQAWLYHDVQAACDVALAQRSYERITLVGKSLGTLAMAHILGDVRFQNARCVWQTPLLGLESLREQITKTKPPSLFIIGTADGNFNQEYLAEVESATQGRSVVLQDLDHSLEIPGRVSGSIEALQAMVEAMQQFIR